MKTLKIPKNHFLPLIFFSKLWCVS